MKKILEINDIHKSYKQDQVTNHVLNNITFSVYDNEILAIVGESGSGKTTIGKIILNLIKPDSGKVFFNEEEITCKTQKEFKKYRKQIQMVFQNPLSSLNPGMTVRQHLEEILRLINTNSDKQNSIESILNQVHLSKEKLQNFPRQLSGGECRRVGLARILLLNPRILILDEPVASLDQSIKENIINLILELKEKYRMTLIWISHDLEVIRRVSSRILVVFRGNLVEEILNSTISETKNIHPYTYNLVQSANGLTGNLNEKSTNKLMNSLTVNNTNKGNRGCIYLKHCIRFNDLSDKRCTQEKPGLIEIDENHKIACFFPSQKMVI